MSGARNQDRNAHDIAGSFELAAGLFLFLAPVVKVVLASARGAHDLAAHGAWSLLLHNRRAGTAMRYPVPYRVRAAGGDVTDRPLPDMTRR